jgi:hypothetical protein
LGTVPAKVKSQTSNVSTQRSVREEVFKEEAVAEFELEMFDDFATTVLRPSTYTYSLVTLAGRVNWLMD